MTSPSDTEHTMGYAVKRLQQALRARMDGVLSRHDLTTPQYAVLALLAERPGISNADLARASFVTAPTMIRIVTTLERAGLLTRSGRDASSVDGATRTTHSTSSPDALSVDSHAQATHLTPSPDAPPVDSRAQATRLTPGPDAPPVDSRAQATRLTPGPDGPPVDSRARATRLTDAGHRRLAAAAADVDAVEQTLRDAAPESDRGVILDWLTAAATRLETNRPPRRRPR